MAAAAVLIGLMVARLTPHADPRALHARIEALVGDPARLQQLLAELRAADGHRISIYDASGKLLASNVQPPLPAPTWGGRPLAGPGPSPGTPGFTIGPPPRADGPPIIYAELRQSGAPALLVGCFERPHFGPLPPLLTLLSGLLVVGVGAALTARWIARPIERLSQTARALGQGQLAARARLARADELGELGRAFDEMADRIESLRRTEQELLANVSHELRTPLARIRVALEIAGEGDAEAARKSLAEIAVDLAELELLVDDVLMATRFELADEGAAARLPLRLVQHSPAAIAARASERFASHHPERPLELELADPLPPIEADAALFHRVIDNLLENAHKYSPDPKRPIALRVRAEAERVLFEVVDRGIGIAEEDLPRIFSAFFRGERSRSRGTGGVGLGLTLAKRIVEAHRGTIGVESSPGTGTTVQVGIPVSAPVHS